VFVTQRIAHRKQGSTDWVETDLSVEPPQQGGTNMWTTKVSVGGLFSRETPSAAYPIQSLSFGLEVLRSELKAPLDTFDLADPAEYVPWTTEVVDSIFAGSTP
jgi:hypothetical protein